MGAGTEVLAQILSNVDWPRAGDIGADETRPDPLIRWAVYYKIRYTISRWIYVDFR